MSSRLKQWLGLRGLNSYLFSRREVGSQTHEGWPLVPGFQWRRALPYTIWDLELRLGEDHHKIAGWTKNGRLRDGLQGTRQHDGNGTDVHRIREKDVLSFIKLHPEEINLGKVDQTWFLDLVLLRGRELRELASARIA